MSADPHRDMGYVIAKLEAMDMRLDAIVAAQTARGVQLDLLQTQILDYTAQWKAVRVIGAVVVALLVFVKTGDTSALKSAFGIGG